MPVDFDKYKQAVASFQELEKIQTEGELVNLLRNTLNSNNVFYYAELLSLKNVKRLNEKEDTKKLFETLNIFAYGDLKTFRENENNFIELDDGLLLKLKQLTLIKLANQNMSIPYTKLQYELEFEKISKLEDFIIDCMGFGFIHGKMDHSAEHFIINEVIPRDAPTSNISDMINSLKEWLVNIKEVNGFLDKTIVSYQQKQIALQKQVSLREKEIVNVKDMVLQGSKKSKSRVFGSTIEPYARNLSTSKSKKPSKQRSIEDELNKHLSRD